MNGRRIAIYFRAFALGYVRNPIGLFFSLFFPIILILIFGAVFANTGSSSTTLYTQNLDTYSVNGTVAYTPVSQLFLQEINQTGFVKVSLVPSSVTSLSNYLTSNSYTDGLIVPRGFQANFTSHTPVAVIQYWDPGAASSSQAAIGAVDGVINGFNLKAAGGSQIISSQQEQIGSQVYTYIDYLVPGLIGFTILTSPMFSMVNIASTWKRDKLFRQLSLTPLTRAEWLTSALLWYVLITIISAFLMIGFGTALFGAHVTLTWSTIPFLILGPWLFVSLGLLAGSVSQTPETAAVIGNVITFPMMFLAGTFFPVSSFSPALQVVAHILPLYYVIEGMNAAMIFGNPAQALLNALIVGIIAVVFFVFAIRAFSWREK
jgi:ABC-2 type transport system permease protein